MKKIIFILGALISSLAYSVDGYKDVKFGISPKQLLEKNICNFVNSSNSEKGMNSYSCNDFKFAGKETAAYAFFLDGKFSRLGISVDAKNVISIRDGLLKKYGKPSATSSKEAFEAADKYPNRTADVFFDDGTVIMRLHSDKTGQQHILLIYTTKDYDAKLLEKQKAKLDDDL